MVATNVPLDQTRHELLTNREANHCSSAQVINPRVRCSQAQAPGAQGCDKRRRAANRLPITAANEKRRGLPPKMRRFVRPSLLRALMRRMGEGGPDLSELGEGAR